VESRWWPVRDKDGRAKSILVINTDVTEKRRIEVQFMRAQRMESLGILAGGIAHDLNNILTPIMLSIDVLKSMTPDAHQKSILETIEISARRGSDIVQQVLSFARGMEGQRIVIQPKYLLKDIEHIVNDTFPKDIRLELALPHETWSILGDPTQVQQILLNLCVNARDAMPNGGTLTVKTENCLADEHYVAMNRQARLGSYVAISVTDVGVGISPDIIDSIFEPFFTTKEVGKGTGLGLSSVKAIVKNHGGFINVYSEMGRGTTFKVYLPAQAAAGEAPVERNADDPLPRGAGETVLVVDDETSILSITSETLQAFGYNVLTASNGAEAVALYAQKKETISAILTDLSMPVMDGRATIYALLKINPKAKIIAMSGMDENESVAKASVAGIKHFISKPYTAATLLKTLRALQEA
jgi:nitrogen-specific signal transduction histidine kinase/CheY-like chemotaxis protein